MSFAILYMRPDGWWVAGDGFVDLQDAIGAGDEHNWNGTDWKVVESDNLEIELCPEAWDAYQEQSEYDTPSSAPTPETEK